MRSIRISTLNVLPPGQDIKTYNWQANSLLSVEAYNGYDGWRGRLPRNPHREDWPRDGVQEDLSKFDELVQLLRPVPRDKIYPDFVAGEVSRYELPPPVDDDSSSSSDSVDEAGQ